ncbi:MAG: PH domain-containing protein [Janthinobacterium lividum]
MDKQVIFNGAPSQVINLPALFKGGFVLALLAAIDLGTSQQFPFQWRVALAQAVAVMIGVALPFLKTGFTEIVVDTERITWKQGILRRGVSSLELSQIKSVHRVQPRWQRAFGISMLIMTTTDAAHPERHLPGIRHAERLHQQLDAAIAAHRLVQHT